MNDGGRRILNLGETGMSANAHAFRDKAFHKLWCRIEKNSDIYRSLVFVRSEVVHLMISSQQLRKLLVLFPQYLQLSIVEFILVHVDKSETPETFEEIVDHFSFSPSAQMYTLQIVRGTLDGRNLREKNNGKGFSLRCCVPPSKVTQFISDVTASSKSMANYGALLKQYTRELSLSPLSLDQMKHILKKVGKVEMVIFLLATCSQSIHPITVRDIIKILKRYVPKQIDVQLKCLGYLFLHVIDPMALWVDSPDLASGTTLLFQYFESLFGPSASSQITAQLHEEFKRGYYPCSPLFGSIRCAVSSYSHSSSFQRQKIIFIIDCGALMNCKMKSSDGVFISRYNFVVRDLMRVLTDELIMKVPQVEVNMIRSSDMMKDKRAKCFTKAQPLSDSNLCIISNFLRSDWSPRGSPTLVESLNMAFHESPDEIFLVTDETIDDWYSLKGGSSAMDCRPRKRNPAFLDKVYRRGKGDSTELLREALLGYWPREKMCPVHSVGIFLGDDHRDRINETRNWIHELALETGGSFRVLIGLDTVKSIQQKTTTEISTLIAVKGDSDNKNDLGGHTYGTSRSHNLGRIDIWIRHFIVIFVLVAAYMLMLLYSYQNLDRSGIWSEDADTPSNATSSNCIDVLNDVKDGVAPATWFFHIWSFVCLWLAVSTIASILPDRQRLNSIRRNSANVVEARLAYVLVSNVVLAFYLVLNIIALIIFSTGSYAGVSVVMIFQIVSLSYAKYKAQLLGIKYLRPSRTMLETGWYWIRRSVLSPLFSFLLSWTLANVYVVTFVWCGNAIGSAMLQVCLIAGMCAITLFALIASVTAKDIFFGLPVVALLYGIIDRWSGDAYNFDDPDLKRIVRTAFVCAVSLAATLLYLLCSKIAIYLQVSTAAYPLLPDRIKMVRIIRKQVANTVCFVLMLVVLFLRSGSLKFSSSSYEASPYHQSIFRHDSAIYGVCGDVAFQDTANNAVAMPAPWWFRLFWFISGYLAVVVIFQQLPYSFLTFKGKHYEHNALSLRLRTQYIQNLSKDIMILSSLKRCLCRSKGFRVSIPTFWKWSLTKSSYRILHTRVGSLFAILCISMAAFQFMFSLGEEEISFLLLLFITIVAILTITKVGVGLDYGHLSHKQDHSRNRSSKLSRFKARLRKISVRRRKHIVKQKENEEDAIMGHSCIRRLFGLIKSESKVAPHSPRRIDRSRSRFHGRVVIYALHWPLSLFVGWLFYTLSIMMGFEVRDAAKGEASFIIQIVLEHSFVACLIVYAFWRHDITCFFPYIVGIVATIHMSTEYTCDDDSYTGYDYRNNYSPPLHTQWSVDSEANCSSIVKDSVNISNAYAWLEDSGGTSRCRVVLDLNTNTTTGTVAVSTNAPASVYSTTSHRTAFEDTFSTFLGNNVSTADFNYALGTVSDVSSLATRSISLGFYLFPPPSNHSSVASAAWESAFKTSSNVNTSMYTFSTLVTIDSSTSEFDFLATDADCYSGDLSDKQKVAYVDFGSDFPGDAKINRGFQLIEGPATGYGYCAEVPRTCDIISAWDFFDYSGRNTLAFRQVQQSILDLMILSIILLVLVTRSITKRRAWRKEEGLTRKYFRRS